MVQDCTCRVSLWYRIAHGELVYGTGLQIKWAVSPCHTFHNCSWPFPPPSILQVKWIAVNIEMRSSEIKAKTAADEHRIL